MGTTNFGNQEITFDYRQPALSQDFNKLNYRITEPGIYDWENKDSGASPLSKVTDALVEVAPMVFFIEDATTGNAVRIETSAVAQIAINAAVPYVVWRFGWLNTEVNYADLLAVSFANIQSTDLVVGRVLFDGATMKTDFDFTRQTVSKSVAPADKFEEFKVFSTEPVSNRVFVNPGTFQTLDNNTITFSGSNSPIISSTGAGEERVDLISIDPSGNVVVTEGTPASSSPVTPTYGVKFVVAEIHLPESTSVITGDYIIDVRNVYRNVISPREWVEVGSGGSAPDFESSWSSEDGFRYSALRITQEIALDKSIFYLGAIDFFTDSTIVQITDSSLYPEESYTFKKQITSYKYGSSTTTAIGFATASSEELFSLLEKFAIVGDPAIAGIFGPGQSRIYFWTDNAWTLVEAIDGSVSSERLGEFVLLGKNSDGTLYSATVGEYEVVFSTLNTITGEVTNHPGYLGTTADRIFRVVGMYGLDDYTFITNPEFVGGASKYTVFHWNNTTTDRYDFVYDGTSTNMRDYINSENGGFDSFILLSLPPNEILIGLPDAPTPDYRVYSVNPGSTYEAVFQYSLPAPTGYSWSSLSSLSMSATEDLLVMVWYGSGTTDSTFFFWEKNAITGEYEYVSSRTFVINGVDYSYVTLSYDNKFLTATERNSPYSSVVYVSLDNFETKEDITSLVPLSSNLIYRLNRFGCIQHNAGMTETLLRPADQAEVSSDIEYTTNGKLKRKSTEGIFSDEFLEEVEFQNTKIPLN